MKRALVLLLLAVSSFASDRATWSESPEAQFMTAEERRAWQQLETEGEAQRFIAEFRARHTRDFTAEVARRAAVVDERLAIGETRASKTLRGRVVLLLGAPAELKLRHITKPYSGSVGGVVRGRTGSVSGRRPSGSKVGVEGWLEYTFRYDARPELGLAESFTVVIEADVISGKDELRDDRERKKLEEVLDAAARVSLRPSK